MTARALLSLVVLSACGDPPSVPSEPTEPEPEAPAPDDENVAPVPEVEPVDVSGERAVLAKGAPAPGPITKLFQDLASRAKAGVVRCPLVGGGRSAVVRGRASDHSVAWGIPVAYEDGSPLPWSPALDVGGSEGDWTSALAVVGSTETVVRTSSRAVRFRHAPVVAGETVVCDAVEGVPDRIVRGHIQAPRPPGLLLMPCVSPPPAIGQDGTFVTRVHLPCRLWVEGGGTKSEQIPVPQGNGPLDLTFHLEDDPMQASGRLTDEALRALMDLVEESKARDIDANTWLRDILKSADPAVKPLTNAMENNLRDRTILTKRAVDTLPTLGNQP